MSSREIPSNTQSPKHVLAKTDSHLMVKMKIKFQGLGIGLSPDF